jgi:hypothetical protein
MARNPTSTELQGLGDTLREQSSLISAEELDRTAADSGHSDAMYALGRILHHRGNIDDAEELFVEAVRLSSGKAEFRLEFGD